MRVKVGECRQHRVGKCSPVKFQKAGPIFKETIEEDRNRFILGSVGGPGAPTFAVW